MPRWRRGLASNPRTRPRLSARYSLGHGAFGYFPSYALGSVIAAQLYESIRTDYPALDDDIAAGKFTELFAWLRNRVHGYGARVTTPELIKAATGKPLSAVAWLRYVEAKYLAE